MIIKDVNKGGRPTKYDYPKFKKLLDKYLGMCVDRYVKLLTYEKKDLNGNVIDTRYEYKLYAHIPTLSGYAQYIGVSRETIYSWTRKYEEFHNLIEWLQTHQMERLVNGGISKKYNQSICCLRLRRLGIGKHRTV